MQSVYGPHPRLLFSNTVANLEDLVCILSSSRTIERRNLTLTYFEGAWSILSFTKLGGCQNYGPFLGTLNIRRRIIIGMQKGTIILTTTQFIRFRV